MHIDAFRLDVHELAARMLPGAIAQVEEFDYGCKRGVVVEYPDGIKHAVKGPAHAQFYPWRWYRPWRRPRTINAMTPLQAMRALVWWKQERDARRALVARIIDEERELTTLGGYA